MYVPFWAHLRLPVRADRGPCRDVVQLRRARPTPSRVQPEVVRRARPDDQLSDGLINTLIVAVGPPCCPPCSARCWPSGLASATAVAAARRVGLMPGRPARPGAGHRAAGVLRHDQGHARSVLGDARAHRLRHGVRRRGGADPAGHRDTSLEEASRDLGARRRHDVRPDHAAAARAGHRGGRAAGVHAVAGRVRDRVLHRRRRPSPRLPIVIYSMVRFGVTPEINALATLLLS